MPARDPDPLSPIIPQLEAHGIALADGPRALIGRYVALLEQWNRRINLTGARDPAELLQRHILDCLMLETVPRAAAPCHWLDVGSGAGLPGLLLAILHPQDRVTAVESVARKATFLRHVADSLALSNFTVLREDVHRLAKMSSPPSRFDIVVARAFAELAVLLRLAPDLLRPAGELWAMKGARWAEERARLPRESLAPFDPEPRQHVYRLDGGKRIGIILVYRLREDFPIGA